MLLDLIQVDDNECDVINYNVDKAGYKEKEHVSKLDTIR